MKTVMSVSAKFAAYAEMAAELVRISFDAKGKLLYMRHYGNAACPQYRQDSSIYLHYRAFCKPDGQNNITIVRYVLRCEGTSKSIRSAGHGGGKSATLPARSCGYQG